MIGAEIVHADYRAFLAGADLSQTVVYADPPYAGTTAYGAVPDFDSSEFWRTMEGCADRGAAVFVSEYAAPEGWAEVWQSEQPASLRGGTSGRVVERLFVRGS